ncbi:MAG: hypothetical protein ACTSR8_12280 [Promethearchaeota archaeon]
MGTKDFAEGLKEKSGIDEEKEVLLGVDNIFKVVDLERELKIRDLKLEAKDHIFMVMSGLALLK